MTKFAANCMAKMNQIINSENILLTLGDDTSVLEMRVGMHSGPVTAGVLRGEKARFQLFGDTGKTLKKSEPRRAIRHEQWFADLFTCPITVNTASRMESNGQKGRIQVSQTTADLLIAAGKDRWLTAREDLVEAKGKGKMQTFWVDVRLMSDRGSAFTSSVAESNDSNGDGILMNLQEETVEDLMDSRPEAYDDELEV
jgi:class 3 adenylate cyclase